MEDAIGFIRQVRMAQARGTIDIIDPSWGGGTGGNLCGRNTVQESPRWAGGRRKSFQMSANQIIASDLDSSFERDRLFW